MKNFRDTEEFSPQEVEAAQNDLMNVLLYEHLYNEAHGKAYPLALDVIRKGKRFVDDSSIGVALADKELFETGIRSCQIFIYAYNNGKITPAMKAFEATSESRRRKLFSCHGSCILKEMFSPRRIRKENFWRETYEQTFDFG